MINFPWRKRPIEPPRHIIFASHIRDCENQVIVGAVVGMTDGEVTYLTDLFVEEQYRGQGRGNELMLKFLEAAEGTTIIVLTTGAEEFYRKFGFTERACMVLRKT